MKEYEVPSWGGLPANMTDEDFYSFEVLKDGSLINQIKLIQKDHFILGRQPDLCDIGLEHPSISRVHAVVQYRQLDGALLIIDLESAHGTFVNKKLLEKNLFHQLSVGDFIKFGASTRAYILHGPDTHRPDEYDSENMRAYRQKLVDQSTAIQIQQQKEESHGIGWGFREDAENYEEDNLINHLQDNEEGGEGRKSLPGYIKNDPNYDRKFGEIFTSTIADTSVSEKDQKLLEKLRKKEKKIQNMQQEISRIYLKENNQDNGLTAGQLAAVERNDRRIEVLREQVEAIERTLNEKMTQRELSKTGGGGGKSMTETIELKKKIKQKKMKEMDDDDDRLDTTDQTADISTNWRLKKKLQKNSSQSGILKSLLTSSTIQSKSSSNSYEAVSYEQLCSEREKKQNRYVVVMKDIQRHDEVIRRCEREEEDNRVRINSAGSVVDGEVAVESDDDDELDRYLTKTQKEESQKLKQDLFQEAQKLMSSVLELEKYIQISAPALSSLTTKGATATGMATSITAEVSSQPLQSKDVLSRTEKEEIEVPQEIISEAVAAVPVKKLEPNKPVAVTNTKKNSRPGSIMAINNASTSIPWDKPGSEITDDRPTKKMRQLAEDAGEESASSDQKSTLKKSFGPTMPKQQVSHSPHSLNELEGGEPVWIPPKNQSGNGITALNAKYGY
jgi:hypothetical protein